MGGNTLVLVLLAVSCACPGVCRPPKHPLAPPKGLPPRQTPQVAPLRAGNSIWGVRGSGSPRQGEQRGG
eukprot:12674712-Alexandrium_andersonii.AAC.1